MIRSPDFILALIMGVDVVNNFAFQPHRRAVANNKGGFDATPVLTFCNCLVSVYTAALGCPIPPMLAKKQHAWLASNEGKMAGWMQVDAVTAALRAETGYPTVAVATGAQHDHIALVVPADRVGPPGVYVSAAGAQNFVRAKLERSFGFLKPEFYSHQ